MLSALILLLINNDLQIRCQIKTILNKDRSKKFYYFQVDCDEVDNLPNITFTIGNTTFNLTSQDYIVEVPTVTKFFYVHYILLKYLMIVQNLSLKINKHVNHSSLLLK